MNRRIVSTVAFVTVGYLVVLAVWLNLFLPISEPGTEGFQVVFLVCLYGTVLGLSLAFAGRRSKTMRRIEREGYEGWATIRSATPLDRTSTGQLTRLDLELTVPGSESYSGTVVYEVNRRDLHRYVPGETVSVWVDPLDRDRIVLYP
ncbi:hypothetical protein [Rhodococcus sp. CH91]|uniref:hypothetical protein n=1 Tax=Rhodococcus sp. CH91 TaxID=2910256 RepID=UPI001F4A0D9C|nr:hypothetical protein [Rhodococcus sp. CH91]